MACSEHGADVGKENYVVLVSPKAPGGVGCGDNAVKASMRALVGRQLRASPWDCLAFLVHELVNFVDLGHVQGDASHAM